MSSLFQEALEAYSVPMRILIANDHGAVERSREVLAWLRTQGHEVRDLGVATETRVDYPDKALEATTEFLKGGWDLGILLCGTGIGISIAANKVRGIRCALVHDKFTAEMARAHNNANFIALGGRTELPCPLGDILATFLDTAFEGGRHSERLAKIAAMEPPAS
jgi:ribose 5-phosphate isomerase B